METALRSHVGYIRQLNEDHGTCIHYETGWVLAVVADGMGGHQAGDIASKMAVQIVKRELETLSQDTTRVEACDRLIKAINTANKEVFQFSLENEDCCGMGTTIVSALATPQWVAIGHIGDSRIYKHSKDQDRLILLTQDHSLVNELQKNGQITEEEAISHPQKNVLVRALGTEQEVTVDSQIIEWKPGEILLLCSDGLTNMVSDDDLLSVLKRHSTPDEQADAMINKALAAGGGDNVTVILIHHSDTSFQEGGDQQ